MKKMSVVLLMPELFHGGAEVQFRHLIERIDKAKFDLTVVVEQSYGERDERLAESFIRKNSCVHFVKLAGLNAKGSALSRYWSFVSMNVQLVPIIRKYRPDIVLCYSVLGLKTMFLTRKLGSLPVYSERNAGSDDSGFYQRNHWLFESAEAILCNSYAAQRVMKKHGVDAICIPNGIVESEILPPANNDHYQIVVPARIATVKNQKVVIKAIAILKNPQIRLTFVGKAESDDYLEYLQKMSRELCVEELLRFVPYTDRIADYYQQADLVILPSYSEGLSNVVLESYMYGRLCLLSNIQMNKDIGNKGQEYFAPGDPEELAALIRTSMQATDQPARIKSNHDFVVAKFGMKNMISAYESLFAEIVSRHREERH